MQKNFNEQTNRSTGKSFVGLATGACSQKIVTTMVSSGIFVDICVNS